MIPRLFWKIFFRGSTFFALFSKKVPPPELNFAEKISDRDFSKMKQNFSKRLNLSNVIWLKFIWFKYELLTPTESKIRASRACHLLFVQGVLIFISVLTIVYRHDAFLAQSTPAQLNKSCEIYRGFSNKMT